MTHSSREFRCAFSALPALRKTADLILQHGVAYAIGEFMIKQRLRQVWEISKYGVNQLRLARKGKAYPIAELDDLAWFASKRKKLPSVSLESIFPGIFDKPYQLQRSLPKAPGNVTVEELCVIALIGRHLRPRMIFEFGTCTGRTTLNLALNAPADARVYTLDLPTPGKTALPTHERDGLFQLGNESGYLFRDYDTEQKIQQLWGDSAEFNEASYRGQMDLIFVDAAHSYEYVCNDTRKAMAMLRPGGVILWHDYCVWYPGVVRLLHELMEQYPIRHIEGTRLAILA